MTPFEDSVEGWLEGSRGDRFTSSSDTLSVVVLVTGLHHSMGHYYHLWAVEGETWNRSAARAQLHPSLTMSWASRSRPVGVSGALAWVMEGRFWCL